jgi:two-component system, cell cycle response regulator CpdR
MIDILLVEDDDALRRYLTKALERAGYCVVAVEDGTRALAIVETGEPFDLLLTDIVMPQMDGVELARRVTALQPDMAVMFITGFSAALFQTGEAHQGAPILAKPFHLKELVDQVDRVLQVAPALS